MGKLTPKYHIFKPKSFQSKRTNKRDNFDKKLRVLSFISKSGVESYTHRVPGDAFFLQFERKATSKNNKNTSTMALFTVP